MQESEKHNEARKDSWDKLGILIPLFVFLWTVWWGVWLYHEQRATARQEQVTARQAKISGLSTSNAATPSDKQKAQVVPRAGRESKTENDFFQSLKNARMYQSLQLYGQADSEYLRALANIPPGTEIDLNRATDAKSAYTDDRFFEAAKLFEEAFRKVSYQGISR
jgi:hypothetical protein